MPARPKIWQFRFLIPHTRVSNDTDTGIDIGNTGISLPTPIVIPIRVTILKKDNYYAFPTAEAILAPYKYR